MRIRAITLVAGALALTFPLLVAAPTGAVAVATSSRAAVAPLHPDVKAFGDAAFAGSTNEGTFNQPIVGIAGTKSGHGYWEVASDGGVFTFGDATYRGSLGGQGITDVVGFSPTPSGNGYWILRKGGGTYSCAVQYGGCPDRSSTSVAGPSVENFGDARRLPEPAFVSVASGRPVYDYDFSGNPVVAIVANPLAQGYFILRSSPGTFGVAGAILTP